MSIKDLVVGSKANLEKLSKNEHKTQPPPRFTETKMIYELERKGLGRPATFASIVSIIQERGYVTKLKGNVLAPTAQGFAAVNILSSKLPKYTEYTYTSEMEELLDEIIKGKVTREKFLSNWWNGTDGFDVFVDDLKKNVDWDQVREMQTLELGNGYSVVYNRFGTFIQDDNGELNDKGFKPSAKIDDDSLIEDYLDVTLCEEIISKSVNRVENNELGTLDEGVYKGFVVTARDGKYGAFVQAVDPSGKTKPINHALPEGVTLETVSMDDVKDLFLEVKLPRTLSPQFFVGIGKKGGYIGFKKTVKTRRAEFKSLPDEVDPRTVSLDKVKEIWEK